ncbi:MAG: DEAD/DEAH box helicase [Vicinamibacterales bacterium]
MSLDQFHPLICQWFSETLGPPTAAQRLGWDAIRDGRHTLIAAPTGSGKTLAAFLTAIDDLVREGLERPLPNEVRVVYVSPLKALSADIHKNLAEPRRSIRALAEQAGIAAPKITAAVRTGDTTQAERAAMLRTPPHILVTTPESLYLLLTAERSREMLRTAHTVIVDEIHAVIGTRRGAHLALSLERLEAMVGRPLQRVGLSATQKPIEDVARFLVGTCAVDVNGRADCAIVDEGHGRDMDLQVEVPRSPLEAVMSHEIWSEYYDRLTELIAEHRTTLVFVNTRRLAERLARQLTDRLGEAAVTAHHGSLSKERRLDAEARLKGGRLKALVATASLELGIDIGSVDLVCQIGSPRRIATLLQRVGRSGHSIAGIPKGRLLPTSRDDLIEGAALLRAVRSGELDRIVCHDAPLDVLSQQIVAEVACAEYGEDALFALVTRAWPYRMLERSRFDAVVQMTSEGFATRRGRRSGLIHRDEVNGRLRGRRGSRLLAISSGGAIPEVADYRVLLDPDDTFIGTLNEDFAIESSAGDIFQLGNASWRVLQVGPGVVRVADAKGAPPTLPFWLGEAPGRSDELSQAVSDLRARVDRALEKPREQVVRWLEAQTGIPTAAAEQAIEYLADGRHALGVLPTQDALVLERFFDESGGMQLVLHAPFGSRINKAWGLALRKRFCRQFNFELQAAATEDALLLSLGPEHSFPLADVFRYLHPATVRDVLVQAFLDAPVFQSRWRWNTTISLAVPRSRGGKKVPPPLQRMLAEDLMAAVFPDAAACLENIPGDREIPDHPLVQQTITDCLHEAMDFEGLTRVLTCIHRGDLQLVSRDTPEPSVLAHEILNARPYAFLDDAPLEERRAHAVYARRASEPSSAGALGALDPEAIARVRDEEQLDVRDADELHDALLTRGFMTDAEMSDVRSLLATLVGSRRAARVDGLDEGRSFWVAAERLPEVRAVHGRARVEASVEAPASRSNRAWTREDALLELARSRIAVLGPTTAPAMADSMAVASEEIDRALQTLEAEGLVLRGSFTPGFQRARDDGLVEWCDRRLLARIHRYTLNRLRTEIEPVSPAEFMRFLFVWHHVAADSRAKSLEGLRAVIGILDGYELPACAWERSILPARVADYEPAMLDMLCLTGHVGWARLSRPSTARQAVARTPPVEDRGPAHLTTTTPISLFLSTHHEAWRVLAADARTPPDLALSEGARRVLGVLRSRGASFSHELPPPSLLDADAVRGALAELVSAGDVVSDGFAGLRSLLDADAHPRGGQPVDRAGRWYACGEEATEDRMDAAVEQKAWALLRRYGVVSRRLLTRESNSPRWGALLRVYRRLELRGEIRGGRFVTGMSGEQFALPEAVTRLREVRRPSVPAQQPERVDGGDTAHRLVVISAADPLNLTGIVTAGDRVRVAPGSRIAYRDGVPIAAMEGDYIRPLAPIHPAEAARVASALAGRTVPPVIAGYVGRTG